MLLLIAYISGLIGATLATAILPTYLLIKMALQARTTDMRTYTAIGAIAQITALVVIIGLFQDARIDIVPGMWLLGTTSATQLIEALALYLYMRRSTQLIPRL